jgi:hypothetical protein
MCLVFCWGFKGWFVVESISGFFEAGRLTVAELGERLVDLGGFSCRCSNDDFRRKSIMHTMVILIGFQ